MELPERPDNEPARLAAVKSLLGVAPRTEPALDRITNRAAALLRAPIALVSLIDEHAQHFLSRHGVDLRETERDVSFCAHTILGDEPLVVSDAGRDPRFADNPLVTGAPFIRFYAGAPLKSRSGHALGALCIIDTEPRPGLDDREKAVLTTLAGIASDLLELHHELGAETGRSRAQVQSRLAALVADSPAAIIGSDLEGRVTDWNPAAERLFGWSAQETLGRPLPFLAAGDAERLRTLLDRVASGEHISGLETRRPTKSGASIDIRLSLAPLRGETGSVIGVLANVEDVSERKARQRQEAERRRRLERYNAQLVRLGKSRGIARGDRVAAFDEILAGVAEAIGVERTGIWLLDDDGTRLTLSRLRDEQAGPTDETEMPSLDVRRYPAYFTALESDRELAVEDVRTDPRTRDFGPDLLDPLGIRSLLDVPIRSHGRLVGVLCIEHRGEPRSWSLEDRSFAASAADFVALAMEAADRRRAEIELRKAKAEAERANRAKSAFLAAMGHELRTPLNGIIGFAELIENEMIGPLGTPAYREYAENIRRSGHRLLEVLNDILAVAKAEAEAGALDTEEWANPRDLVERAQATLGSECARSGVAIELSLPADPPAVRCDPAKLQRALAHLIANAVKFSEREGRVRISAQHDASGLAIAIADNGIGMRAEDIPRALTAFRQLDETLARAHDGIGVGLPLAKHFVELHEGRLEIESAPGEGTTVTVRLPASRLLPAPASAGHGRRRASG